MLIVKRNRNLLLSELDEDNMADLFHSYNTISQVCPIPSSSTSAPPEIIVPIWQYY